MTHQEILTKAIEKAIAGGLSLHIGAQMYQLQMAKDTGKYRVKLYKETVYGWSASDIIFRHDFAKSLWPNAIEGGSLQKALYNTGSWQYHLQQMVIAEDPIAYLGKHL